MRPELKMSILPTRPDPNEEGMTKNGRGSGEHFIFFPLGVCVWRILTGMENEIGAGMGTRKTSLSPPCPLDISNSSKEGYMNDREHIQMRAILKIR